MRDENNTIDLEVASNGLEVVYLRGGRENRRIARQRRAAGAALVVEDHDVFFGERHEVAVDALEIDTGAAVHGDDRVAAAADHTIEEPDRIARRDVPFVGFLGASARGGNGRQRGKRGREDELPSCHVI